MSTEVKLPESQLHDDAGAGPKPTESRPKSTDAIRHLSMSFEESGLSRLVHAGSWQKANELVAKENAMYPVPGTQNNQAFFVESRELKHQAILRRRRRPEVNFCSGRRSGVVCQVLFVSRERESLHFGVVSRT